VDSAVYGRISRILFLGFDLSFTIMILVPSPSLSRFLHFSTIFSLGTMKLQGTETGELDEYDVARQLCLCAVMKQPGDILLY
jgi:hypothetical protein